ncbi:MULTISPECIES: ATP-binding protein [unclassified Luteimonas]|uniref:ATP-binding protein n=1 Tax=unclassified Luteimonas TaxID=2629088 RepID=UPI0018F0644A|nr:MULTISPECIES: ATP-binding protein [unclassified Luteimonas]MBJ6979962.1 PAS domain-containing protein [Luteimonas sp. MC1895]MBJ6983280.1 PAS domain-containing protein [Luteimonas sp. MC1750]QQO06146.1 PAS domain-containing protein [Luteimonas sp. MC1750]
MLSASFQLNPRWRIPLLFVSILLIVVIPFLLMRTAEERIREADESVAHTLEVEATVQLINASVRNIEAATLERALGARAAVLEERLDYSSTIVNPSLDRLEELTRDSAHQQVRVGTLRQSIAQRIDQVGRLVDSSGGIDGEELQRLAEHFPVQEPIAAMVRAEREFLAERQALAARARTQADWLSYGTLAAQILLLVGLATLAIRDSDRRGRAEAESQRANRRSAAVLDTVREPIVLVDAGLDIVMHNAAFAELFGIDDDARGRNLAEAGEGAWNDGETLRRLRDVCSRGRELWDFELQQKTVDGVDRTMLVNARLMELPDSEETVALVTASDISLQKASEEHIRDLNRQLEGKVEQVSDVNRELEAFSYSVSHDLRAPLRHIAGFADKLRRHLGGGIDDKGTHYLDVIGGSAKRMSELIDDLLVYSRLGRSALRLQAVDMQSLVEETRAMLDSNVSAEAPGHHVQWKIGAMPVLVADENMLRQLWGNLLGNAVKYSMQSEPATVTVEHARDAEGDHVFTVRDNGAGFDMAYAGKLFGVFQRLHSPSEFSGTGIGLASAKRVVTRHNGRIWAEAEPGKGATFHFTLPANLDLSKRTPTA